MISCDPRAFALLRPWAEFFGPFGPLGLGGGWGGDKGGMALLRWLRLGRGGFGIEVTGGTPVPLCLMAAAGEEASGGTPLLLLGLWH